MAIVPMLLLRPSLAIPPLRGCRGARSISVIYCGIGALLSLSLSLLLSTAGTAGSHAGTPGLLLDH